MKSMIHNPVPLSAVFVYAAKSLGLFLALMAGIFAGLMIQRTFAKRFLEGIGKQEATSVTTIALEERTN